jgi:enoyl-CoA hydratase/carnithine racemase
MEVWMATTIKCSTSNGVMTIVLSRPEKLNAFNASMKDDLLAALDEADANDGVRTVLFTGEGRAYCAGGELPEQTQSRTDSMAGGPTQLSNADSPIERDPAGIVSLRLFSCLKPLIAAVNGAAIGFGATMLLPMDIRIASTKARFGFPFVAFGGLPEAASSWFLPRIVGTATALEWCLTGETVSAQHALERGLVRSVHEPEALMDASFRLAEQIVQKASPVSAATTRQMLWRLSAYEHPMVAHRIESQLLHYRIGAADMKEGLRSYFEKRQPNFPDLVSTDMPAGFPWWNEPHYGDHDV